MTRVLPTTAARFVYSGGGRLSFACVCHEHSQCCFIARRNAVDPKWCYLSVCVAVTYVGQQLCHCVWAASGGVFLHCLAYSVVQDVASRPRFSGRGYAVSVCLCFWGVFSKICQKGCPGRREPPWSISFDETNRMASVWGRERKVCFFGGWTNICTIWLKITPKLNQNCAEKRDTPAAQNWRRREARHSLPGGPRGIF